MQTWLSDYDVLNEKCLLLTHLMGGQPGRIEELAGLLLAETPTCRREVYVLQGDMAVLPESNKSRNLTGRNVPLARFVDPSTGALLVVLWGVARPLHDELRRRWSADGRGSQPVTTPLYHDMAGGAGHASRARRPPAEGGGSDRRPSTAGRREDHHSNDEAACSSGRRGNNNNGGEPQASETDHFYTESAHAFLRGGERIKTRRVREVIRTGLRRVLRAGASGPHVGVASSFGSQTYRQIVKALAREHLSGGPTAGPQHGKTGLCGEHAGFGGLHERALYGGSSSTATRGRAGAMYYPPASWAATSAMSVLDRQAGHGGRTASMWYGHTVLDPRHLDATALETFRQASQAWHRLVLGGPQEPPAPGAGGCRREEEDRKGQNEKERA